MAADALDHLTRPPCRTPRRGGRFATANTRASTEPVAEGIESGSDQGSGPHSVIVELVLCCAITIALGLAEVRRQQSEMAPAQQAVYDTISAAGPRVSDRQLASLTGAFLRTAQRVLAELAAGGFVLSGDSRRQRTLVGVCVDEHELA